MALKQVRGRIKSHEDALITEVKAVKETGGERRLSGLASTPNVDRVGEIVDVDAFTDTIKAFKKNPIMLFMHNPYNPIGKFDDFELTKQGLWVSGVVGKGFDPADRAWEMISQGILKAFSIGFREVEGGPQDHGKGENKTSIYHITKLELYEVSPVSIPANREALFTFDEGGKLVDITMLDEDKDAAEREVETLNALGSEQKAVKEGEEDIPMPARATNAEMIEQLHTEITTLKGQVAQLEADAEHRTDQSDVLEVSLGVLSEKMEQLEQSQNDFAKVFIASLARDVRKLKQQLQRPAVS